MAELDPSKKLQKTLGLFDVYAISTGAMFSSGFFLLPGIASAYAGPSVVLAYLAAGILVLPAMFSQAELCTAMPRAGGTYYFLDRSLGPLAGTVGGIGTWLSLVFKSAFALLGMGAYLVLFVELPIKPVAIALTVVFAALNIFGAKETSGLQRILVIAIVGILTFFIVQGLFEIFSPNGAEMRRGQFTPFMPYGTEGLVTTIGLVFVSYAGLTKVASVAEEVENPDRNIPLGMILSLGTATLLYAVGVYIMVAVLDPAALREDLTPVATAAEAFFDWLPASTGLLLIVIAAISAFASTGNAGILSASRYPLAMGRDHLVTRRFAEIGRFGTPTLGILITAGSMIFFIIIFSEQGVAKLASAFNLLIFGMLNLAVIVMRESHIPSYAPGYRSPLYPWMQLTGILTAVVLIAKIGLLSILFTVGIIVVSIGWYIYYVRNNADVEREGAIYHLFERLGRHRYEGLEKELHGILEEKELTDTSDFEQLIARAAVLHLDTPPTYEEVVHQAAEILAERSSLSKDDIVQGFLERSHYSGISVTHNTALPYYLAPNLEQEEMVIVRCKTGTCVEFGENGNTDSMQQVYALFFLLTPRENQGLHLHTQAVLANRVEEDQFLAEWQEASNEQKLKEALLHHERYLSLHLRPGTPAEDLIDQRLADLNIPASTLVALIRRKGDITIPRGSTVLKENDRITIIGDPAGIERLYELYRKPRTMPSS